MGVSNNWKITNDQTKNTLRISSFESDCSDGRKLPLDVEIFQNLIDNICRKFDTSNGENLLCFGGCAIYNTDGTLNRIENFLPKYPSLLKNWLKTSQHLRQGFSNSQSEPLSMTDSEIQKNIFDTQLENGDKIEATKVQQRISVETTESCFHVTSHNTVAGMDEGESKASPSIFKTLEDPKTEDLIPKKSRSLKFKVKSGVPVPPRPVLSLSQEDIKDWFPQLIEKLSAKKFPTAAIPKKCIEWDTDVEKVLSFKDFSDNGPRPEFNWSKVSANFYWKLKLVAAILLDKKGVDYTTFAEKVEDKHEKYSIDDLKLMSMSKNPETFEKLFVRKCTSSKLDRPSYVNEFEKKSSEIILQNFRLINARDKKLNGNSNTNTKSSSRKNSDSSKTSKAAASKSEQTSKNAESTSQAVIGKSSDPEQISLHNILMNGIKVTPLIDAEDTSLLLCEDLEPTKCKRKKSSDSAKEEKINKDKVPNQRFLCKNNFQKGDYLIHPSQLNGKFGPVKLVTYRRETKKVFLCVSEFETIDSSDDDFVIMEKCSHKSRSTPAKFLDSYIKINDLIEVTDKSGDRMKIKRVIPKNDAFSKVCDLASDVVSPDMKEEVIDLDELVNDEAFEEELDALDDNEMVIDESRS